MAKIKLIDNLNKQIRSYEDLLQLARKKGKVLVDGQVHQLDKLLQAEQALILKTGRLEEERLRLLEDLAKEYNLAPQDMTLKGVCLRLPGETRREATGLEEKLQGLLGKLREANHLNQQLIKQSLDYIEFSLGLVSADRTSLLDEKA
jgi:hypothetical protein